MSDPITRTHSWIEEFIIGMEICPFAKKPFEEKRFRLSHCDSSSVLKQKDFFVEEMTRLLIQKKEILSNSFLIFSHASLDYLEFLDFFYECEDKLSEELQLVCFHPHFYFQNTEQSARVNWVNRSPYPSLHLLRVEEVSAVITHEQMGEVISKTNEKKLMAFSEKDFQALTRKWQI